MIRLIANSLLDPLNLFWMVLLAGFFFLLRRKKKTAGYFFTASLIWMFLISSSPLPSWLCAQRESRHTALYPIPDSLLKADTVHIAVLGAGHVIAPNLPPNNQLSSSALGRLTEGVRLYRLLPRSKLICSGFSPEGRTSQAEILSQAAVSLGVSPFDTLISPLPLNTEAEAYAYAARFDDRQPLILVTNAIHMPRALFWFRRAGLNPIPAPTNHYVKFDPQGSPYNFKPSPFKIIITDRLMHEWGGMIYAKWKAG